MIDFFKKKLKVFIDKSTHKINSTAFTIVSKNYLHYALTLRESFLQNNPHLYFSVFVVDMLDNKKEFDEINNLISQGVEIVFLKDILNLVNIPEYETILFRYDILEANTAFKPYILEYLLKSGYEKVIYLDPDCFVMNNLSEVENLLETNDIVLTPHILEPYNDDKIPGELHILRAGIYNLGFIAIRDNANTLKFLNWWQKNLKDKGYMLIEQGMHVDQKWIDPVPVYYEKVHILKSKGYNVAYWNLHERPIKKIDSKYLADDTSIVFFHFSGLPTDKSDLLSKHQNRYNISENIALAELTSEYRKKLKNNGSAIFSSMKYYFDKINDDLPITKEVRRELLEKVSNDLENPFKPDLDTYNKYFDIVYEDLFSDKSLNNYGYCLWRSEMSLNTVYRDLSNPNIRKDYKDILIREKNNQKYYYNFPEKQSDLKLKFGLNTVGYNSKPIGVAEVSRSFIKNLYCFGIPNSIINLESSIHADISDDEYLEFQKYDTKNPIFNTNILFCNADVINNIFEKNPVLKNAKNNIGVFWWEFEDYFDFPKAFDNIDEVLSFSSLVTKAVKKVAPKHIKVKQLLFPFIKQWKISHSKEFVREKYNISEDDFVLFFNFDFHSSIERKNPFAVLNAFETALGNKKDVKLIFKSTHADQKPEDYQTLKNMVIDKKIESKVIFINESLPKNDLMSIINSSDAYVSMHKSEGFGIGMLEAMFLSKPVIGTNYGGNTDFMNSENSLLLDYNMTEVINDFGPYRKGWLWAEPNFEQAVEYMKKLYENREFGIEIGKKAFESVNQLYSRQNLQLNIMNYLKTFI